MLSYHGIRSIHSYFLISIKCRTIVLANPVDHSLTEQNAATNFPKIDKIRLMGSSSLKNRSYHLSFAAFACRGAYERGRLIREGVLFKKLAEEDINDNSTSLLTHILRIPDVILRVKYIDSTDFDRKLYQNQHAKVFKQIGKKILVTSEI